jgi:hypothetical protein
MVKLKYNCPKCHKEVKTNWKVCPYCWEPNLNPKEFMEEEKRKLKEEKWNFLKNIFSKGEIDENYNDRNNSTNIVWKKEKSQEKIKKNSKKGKKINLYLAKKRKNRWI